jgi:hypothetical protein
MMGFPRHDGRWPSPIPEPIREEFDLEEIEIIQHLRESHHIDGGWNIAFGCGDEDAIQATNKRLAWRKAERRRKAEEQAVEEQKKRAVLAAEVLKQITLLQMAGADYTDRLALEDEFYEIVDWPGVTPGQCRIIRGFNLFALQSDQINLPDTLILRGIRDGVCRFVAKQGSLIRSSQQ